MIAYTLVCAEDHEFEAWFKDGASYDAQEAGGELICPLCGDTHIRKGVMAPSVKASASKRKQHTELDPAKVRKYMAGYRKFIEKNAEYVGPRFPEEARKVHYGEAKSRHIYGESTIEEARELIEEGVDIAPLPPDPDALN
ncbi:MAG: DUF1178 family protein [Proteobacteria bacterium]|nr:DUF1178 family protein [Pseudomonadota bacterium]